MPKTFVVVGGVAGGATAAAKLRREDEHAEIVMIERGPYLSFANCGLPYFIGGEITDRSNLLLMTPESFWAKYRINAKVNSEVLSVSRENQTVVYHDAEQGETTLRYDKLLLAQGAQPLVPPLPGIGQDHVFTLRSVPDMDQIDTFRKERAPKKAVVIGGGFIGLEMAEAFIHQGMDVCVVEMAPHILPPLAADMAAFFTAKILNEFATPLRIISGAAVQSIEASSVTLSNGETVDADLVLVSAGVRPEVALAKSAGLGIGKTGGVVVNSQMRTEDPNIYAAGDAAETLNPLTGHAARVPLAGPANRQGRIAAINMTGGSARYCGAQGTSIVRMGSVVAATTGLSPRQAGLADMKFVESTTFDNNHAGYYPGAEPMLVRVVFQPGTGTLLGAQVVGGAGADKRIDVFATAIKGNLTVEDLQEIDLAYAPPFGSANDPVNVAGFVGTHLLLGEIETLKSPDELADVQLLDLRNPQEIEALGTLKGAINIPVPELRDRLDELDANKPTIVFCQKGARGYLGYCILRSNGFLKLKNIPGGYLWAKANGFELEA